MYFPEEDSYFLAETLKKYLKKITNKNIKILDLGAGTGIQSETCISLGFKNILTADIDKESIKALKQKGFQTKKSNLFSNIKDRFDLIVFNAPYLPENKYDKKLDTTGGKKGYELIIRFLKQARKHLNKNGKILLLFSSYTQPKIIKKKTKELGYKFKKLAGKKLFYEELIIIEIKV